MIRSTVAIGVLAMIAHNVLAQSADDSDSNSAEAAFSNDTLQLRYIDVPRADLGGGRASGTFFRSEERDIVLSADLLFPLELDIPRFSIRFGPRASTHRSGRTRGAESGAAISRLRRMRWFGFDLTEGSGERTLQEELFAGVGWRFALG
jgi:hypothetical protein